jgi:hypothetical protein
VRRGNTGIGFLRRGDSFQVDSTCFHCEIKGNCANWRVAGANRSLHVRRLRRTTRHRTTWGCEVELYICMELRMAWVRVCKSEFVHATKRVKQVPTVLARGPSL